MKVVAVKRNDRGQITGAVMDIAYHELSKIIGDNFASYNARFYEGQEVDIIKPYLHSKSIEDKAAEFVKLPGHLRTLADMLEMTVPAIETVVADLEDDELIDKTKK